MIRRGLLILTVSGIVCAVLLLYWVRASHNATTKASTPPQFVLRNDAAFIGQLASVAKEVNSTTPRMVDESSRLDGAMAGPGRRLTFRYTLINYKASDLPTIFDRKYVPVIREQMCNSGYWKKLIGEQVLIELEYWGRDGIIARTIPLNSIFCALHSPR